MMENIERASKKIKLAREKEEQDFKNYVNQLDEAESKIKERHQATKSRISTLAQSHGNPHAANEDIIEINVGGKIIAAKRRTLCQLQDTKLGALFSGRWERKLLRDNEGRIFLNLNPISFQAIVDYLNELAISPPENLPQGPSVESEYDDILRQHLYLVGLSEHVHMLPLPDSKIIESHSERSLINRWLAEEGEDGDLHLLYRLTSEQYGIEHDEMPVFHAKCDHKGPTVTLIKCKEHGFVIGGYSNASWTSDGESYRAHKSFLFQIRPLVVQKMKLKSPGDREAIVGNGNFGPTFGKDLNVCEGTNRPAIMFNPGNRYEESEMGDMRFQSWVEEMEVFQVVKKQVKPTQNFISIEPTESFTSDVNDALNEKLKELIEAEKEVSCLEKKLADEEKFIEFMSEGSFDDIVSLNVSGTGMTTKQSTIQFFQDSVLARQFDEVWNRTSTQEKICVDDWSPTDVLAWIKDINGVPDNVVALFEKEQISGTELLALKERGLKMLGITRLATICLLLDRIEKLEKESRAAAATLIQHSPYCFGKILDFLRLQEMYSKNLVKSPHLPKVREGERERFEKVVNFYFPGDDADKILGR